MSSSPRERMRRQPNRPHSAHAGQSLDPALTRQGVLAHPGSLAMCFAALSFFAYVFNLGGLQTGVDGFLSGLNTTVASHNNDVATWFVRALPYIGIALLAMMFFIVLSKVSAGPPRERDVSSASRQPGMSRLDEFVKAAAEQQVSERVAREAYSLLAPRYGRAAIALSDSLVKRLGMTENQIADMQGTLMRYTDRQIRVGKTETDVETVLDLMKTVEVSTVRSVPKSATVAAGTGEAVRPTPAMEENKVQPVAPKSAAATFVRPYRPAKPEHGEVAKRAAQYTTPVNRGT